MSGDVNDAPLHNSGRTLYLRISRKKFPNMKLVRRTVFPAPDEIEQPAIARR